VKHQLGTLFFPVVILVAVITSGCSSSDDPPENPTVDLSTTDDLQIRQSAANNALESFTQSLNNSAQLSDDPIPVLDSSTLDPVLGENVTGQSTNQQEAAELNTDADNLLATSMGLEQDSQAVVTQNGNQIIIDPDEAELCRQQMVGNVADQQAFDECLLLAADLLIQIDAQTEETGSITFLFRESPLLVVTYAPTAASYEIQLAGLKRYTDAEQEISGSTDNALTTMVGAIRVSTSFDPANAEAGNLSIDISDALQVTDTDGSSLTIAPGTLLSVTTVAGTGNGSIEMNMGAVNLSSSNPQASTDVGLSMAGLTARVDLTRDGQDLKMSNLGLAQGPLTVTINSVEQIRLTLETLGFTISESSGELILDTDLDLGLFLLTESGSSDSDGLETQEVTTETQLDLSAVAGTGLLGQISSTMVTQGGPFSISLVRTEDALTVEAGQCFGDDGDESNGDFDILPCDVP